MDLLPWSFGIPYAETSWEDRRESSRHPTPTGIFFLVFDFEDVAFKAVLKDFFRFFNDIILILAIENIGNRKKLWSSIFSSIDKTRKLIGSKESLDKITRLRRNL